MKKYLLYALAGALLAACGKDETVDMASGPDTPGGEIRFEIGFAPMDGAAQTEPHTRVATDTQFNSRWEEGDEIGLYAVEHDKLPAASGNYFHNVKLTYTGGRWTAAERLDWPVNGMKLDFYAYYPYDAAATNPMEIVFKVQSDQSVTKNYNRSDLLTASADNNGNGFGKGETVQLSFKHALAMVQVNVSKSMIGNYPDDILTVFLGGCSTECRLNLFGQSTISLGTISRVTMYPCPNDNTTGIYAYRALVPMQSISPKVAMFLFVYDNKIVLHSKPLTQQLFLMRGRAETFDMTFPYTLATVSSTVRLTDLFGNEELAQITHLKVLGDMTADDFTTIRGRMPLITNIDLGGATMVNGYDIPDHLFENRTSLKEFVFPRNITSIGNYAFSGCSGLTGDLKIPQGVKSIGNYAFDGCSSLTGDLKIPQGVEWINERAFYNCRSLTGKLTIPEGVKSIGNSAFMNCSGLTGDLKIPQGVESIGNSAFEGCSDLNGKLTIPQGVKSIGYYAFYGCKGLTGELKIPEGVTSIREYAFYECRGLTGDLVIPKGVTRIESNAFCGCSGLNGKLTIPEGVEWIGMLAFGKCSGLIGELKIPKTVMSIGNGAFNGCSSFTGDLVIPPGVTTIESTVFGGCSGFKGKLVIPEGVTSIGNGAFGDCSGLTGDLVIPQEVKSIGQDAFFECSGFKGKLTIPEGVKSIGNGAFYGCSSLTGELKIPSNVTVIEERVFLRCSSFTKLVIHDGVKQISNNAFWNCEKLQSIYSYLPNPGDVKYGSGVFDGIPTSIPVYIPNNTFNTYRAHTIWKVFTNFQYLPAQP